MVNKLKQKLLEDFNALVELGRIKNMGDMPRYFDIGEILLIIEEAVSKLVVVPKFY